MIWILFFYCVFKAKYFQNGSILDAKKKKSLGSYVWKSILKARRVISLGARQRVGDRKSRSVQRKLDVGKL